MKEIEKYIEFHDDIDRCDFRIAVLKQDEVDKGELAEVEMLKAKLQNEILVLKDAVSEENLYNADLIRISYISVFNNYIEGFAVAKNIGKVVDLDQSMMNHGYLLGMLIHDLFGVLKTAGETIPLSYFMYSSRKWESTLLLDAITAFREKIMQNQFHNYLQGIEFYFEFRQAIRQIADKLRTDRVIY